MMSDFKVPKCQPMRKRVEERQENTVLAPPAVPANVELGSFEQKEQPPKVADTLLHDWRPTVVQGRLCFQGIRVIGESQVEYKTTGINSRAVEEHVKLLDETACKLAGSLTDYNN